MSKPTIAKRRGRLSERGGMALIMVLGVMTFLTTMQLQMMVRGLWQSRAAERAYDRANALSLAESALTQASVNLRTPTGVDDIVTDTMPTGTFVVNTPQNLTGTLYRVVGEGASDQERRRLEAVYTLKKRSIFQFAVFGSNRVTVSGSTLTDSYDSREGLYNDDETDPNYNRGRNGDIGTNSTTLGGISMDGATGVFIDGQVAVGYGIANPYSVVTGYDPLMITGGTDPPSDYQDVVGQTETFPMPAVTIPAGMSCNDRVVLEGETLTLTPNGGPNGDGVYCFKHLTIEGAAQLTSSGKVTVYVTGQLKAVGDSLLGTPSSPKDFLIKMTWSGRANLEPGQFIGTTGFYGALYAPQSAINISGNAEIYGSIIAGEVNVDGEASVHYDEGLADLIDISNTFATQRISWREL